MFVEVRRVVCLLWLVPVGVVNLNVEIFFFSRSLHAMVVGVWVAA